VSAVVAPLLERFLATLIQIPHFWRVGLRLLYADPRLLNSAMVLRYRWPAQMIGAGTGVLRFVLGGIGHEAGGAVRGKQGAASNGGAGHLASATVDASDEALLSRINAIGIPVLLVHGAQDRLVPVSNTRRLMSLLPAATFVQVERCGHMPQEEQTAKVTEAICSFLVQCGVCSTRPANAELAAATRRPRSMSMC
jgi:pimeloyl-ACP methyl ester carboxylesterase